MKKLGKLTLNEMQEFSPLSPEEQMGMKGGMANFWGYMAWEVEKGSHNEIVCGSGSTSQGASTIRGELSGIQPTISGSRSFQYNGMIQIYYPDVEIDIFGSRQYL
jgi:hypothetical protein